VQECTPGAGVPARQRCHPQGHQVRLDPVVERWPREADRFRVCGAGERRSAEEKIAGGHALLDGARGDFKATVRHRGGHLVAGDYGH